MYLSPSRWLRLLFVLRRGSVAVDSLFYVPHKACGGSVLVFCLLIINLCPFLILQSS